jgi:hypothetical protein
MAYTPDAACLEAAEAAAGTDTLLRSEILEAFEKVNDYRASLLSQGINDGMRGRLGRFAVDAGERAKLAAAISRKHAALNIIVRDKTMAHIGNLMRAGLTPRQAMLALLEGAKEGVEGGRKSVQAMQQSMLGTYYGGMMAQLEREAPHLVRLVDNLELNDDIIREMMELRDGGTPGSTGNSDAKLVASVFAKWAERMRRDLNKLGANIGKLDGWAGVQMHDPLKLMQISPEAWAAKTIRLLDIERTFPDGPDEVEALDRLVSIYDTIVTGVSRNPNPRERGQRVGPANMANSLGKHRVLHFKDADATVAYREEFGYGNIIDGMLAHMRNGARAGGAMAVFGPNPEAMFVSIAEEMKRRIRNSRTLDPLEKRKLIDGLQTDTGPMRHALDIATGLVSAPGNTKWAEIGTSIRAVQSMAKLGGAVISSGGDTITAGAAAQFRGYGFWNGFTEQLSSILQGRPTGQAAEVTYLAGTGFEGFNNAIASNFAATDNPVGILGKLQELFFRFNGLTWWTDVQRGAAGRTIAAEMGMRSRTIWSELPDAYRHVLGLHDITEAKWDVIRESSLRQVDGRDYLTPDRILDIPLKKFEGLAKERLDALDRRRPADPAEYMRRRHAILEDTQLSLQRDVGAFFADELDYAVIMTDARSKRTSTWGTRPGTLAGEALRFVMQFKGWPIAFTQRILGREFFGRRAGSWNPKNEQFWSETLPHIGTLIAGLTLSGWAAMTVKDALKGYGPRDPGDPRTWMAALQQGGAWGIYGDFIFSSRNRFGGGLVETAMGPTFGTAGDLWQIVQDARDAAITGGEDTFSGSKMFSSVWANVPYANLFYAKPVLDYLVLNSLREALSPGYLRGQTRRRELEYGQERLDPFNLGQTLVK